MRIAIIGSGISGLSAAYLLHSQHEVTIYEKENRLGGHARTRDVNGTAVDTGFIVFNDRNYPNLLGLFAELGVETIPSNMSFAASIDGGVFEYSSKSLRGIFYNAAQLFDRRRWAMGRDYFRFSRYAKNFLKNPDDRSLGQLVRDSGVGEHFAQYFILPIGGAIWSCPVTTMMDYPARTFVQFFENHGLLDVNGQPQWRTVKGGSREYIKKLSAAANSVKLKLQCAPVSVTRSGDGVTIKEKTGTYARYDHVIMAAHADESLALLANPSEQECAVLGAFKFQPNMAYLHGDIALMPKEKRCWASWVYLCDGTKDESPNLAVSYWMNLLQSLPGQDLIVTLNPATPPKHELTYDQHLFHHPIFDEAAVQAQAMIPSINGVDRISYVGAWQRYGFHEDGIWSAVRVAKQLGAKIPWEDRAQQSAPAMSPRSGAED